MWKHALHHIDRIGPRTLVALQDLDLFETPVDHPIGSDIDLDVFRDPYHPRREDISHGPLLLYFTEGEIPKRILVEIPMLLLSQSQEVRRTAYEHIAWMVAEEAIKLTPKTIWIFEKTREGLLSDEPRKWRPAAIALSDALGDDLFIALHGVRQCTESNPIIQDSLNEYARRLIHPPVSSFDSIVLEVANPEQEHENLATIVSAIITEATGLQDACKRYYERLGYLPLAPGYAMSEVATLWMSTHPETDAWTEVWQWAHDSFGPIPRYHACSVFVINPELVPEGKLSELWEEILSLIGSKGDEGTSAENEKLTLRCELARHYSHHLEAHIPDGHGASISCFSLWLAEQVASLFPDDPTSAQFYRDKWIKPAAFRSALIWATASPRIEKSFLRYATASITSPWATALLAQMGKTFEKLALQEQPIETQKLFYDALVLCMIGALPFFVESPSDPTYAWECPLSEIALKLAVSQTGEPKEDLERLVETSRALGSNEGLCAALRKMAESSFPDQVTVGLALKAKAYTDLTIADAVWEVLSDSEWRDQVLGTVEDTVLGLLVEAFGLLQADKQDKWFYLYPHYLAELCEKSDKADRRQQLFLYLIHASLASDTVSAIRRLLRGRHKAEFAKFIDEFRKRVEGAWPDYPAWVQSRLRGLLASLRTI